MNQCLLTIAIPTYNRKPFLKENLDVLLPQVEEVPDQIEILISDNASTDGTKEYVNEIKDRFNISYSRNTENLGADGNFLQCFYKAQGEYLLILSDDDILLPGSLKKLLALLKGYPAFVFTNCCGFIGQYQGRDKCGSPTIKLNEDCYCHIPDEFIEKVGIHITFVSALCYKMESVKKIRNIQTYCKTDFLQSYIALETIGMMSQDPLCISAVPLIAARGGNTGGYNLYTTWFKNFYDLMLSAPKLANMNNKLIQKVLYHSYKSTIFNFVRMFRLQQNSLDLKGRDIVWKVMKHYPFLWCKTLFWVYTPKNLLLALKRIKRG